MNIEKIQNIILDCLKEYAKNSPTEIKISDASNTAIFGPESSLDSLGLVTLIVEIEQNIEDEFGVEITIADEKAMSMRNSPFMNVESLSSYINELI
jgi:acyl carrier protein